MRLAVRVALLMLLLGARIANSQDPNGQVHGFVSFSIQRMEVDEDSGNTVTTVQLPLVREVGSSGIVLATVEVTNTTAGSDFFSSSTVVSFVDGVTSGSAILLLQNDDLPEGNETFIVNITGTRFGAEVGSVDSLLLIVRGSDEPHGDFQFATGSRSVSVAESTGDRVVELVVERSPGIFGRVTVDYSIVDGPGNGVDDISPTEGQLVFGNGVGTVNLSITITTDDIPEDEESFTIRLSNPTGGAGLADSGTEAIITIDDNDTPLRFSMAQYTVDEDGGSVVLTVTRGVLNDGTEIGNITKESTVDYTTIAGTAEAGTDYDSLSGTLTFTSGVASINISIPILDDTDPEGDELFSVSLSNPSTDAVLSTPSSTTVLIEVNDNAGGLVQFSSAGPIIVPEDDGSTAEFVIQRLNGSYSDIIVQWRIVDSSDELASDDFDTSSGNLTILDGESEGVLQIQPTNDDSSEIAERFSVELTGVVGRTGELQPMGIRIASLIIEDSDDVYGLVELASDSQLHVTSGSPRQLHLEVSRSPGTTGTISVDYYVTYLPSGVSDPADGDSSVFATATGSVRLVGGQMTLQWDVDILSNAFLDTNGKFYVSLNSTTLVEGVVPLVTPTNSPRLGPRSEAEVSIPNSAANGYISFSQSSITTQEPDTEFGDSLALELTRTGAYGTATITWRVVGITTDSNDLGTVTGMTQIANGSTVTSTDDQILVVIINDNVPEVDETFEVQLVSVAESSQRIDPEHNTSVVTIELNDNADGVFTLSSSQSSYTITESSQEVITISIQRAEGALTTQTIQYQTLPGSGADFIGSVGVAVFSPGETEVMVFVLPNDDDIPENTEEFNFTITASNSDFLGNVTSIGITIEPNDEYAGVFSFADSSLQITIDEPGLDGVTSTATLTVVRDRGVFTDVTVYWEIDGSDVIGGDDVSPTSGNITFSEDQETATFSISATADEIPEDDIHYTVALVNVSGDGELATSSIEAMITVSHNDDPINLRNTSLEAREGETVELVVNRGGHTNGEAEVSYQVTYTSASTDDVILTPVGLVTLEDGVEEVIIAVTLVDDNTPEETEQLSISLASTTGDAVLVSPTEAVISILPSDDPNGVFVFANDSFSTDEGDSLLIIVERLEGLFGRVEIMVNSYQLNTTTGDQISTNTTTDIHPTSQLLIFAEDETSANFTLEIINEETPEFQEQFELVLAIVDSTRDSEDGARLGSPSSSLITVSENDDPHGLFVISSGTSDVEVAEDVGEGEEGGGRVEIAVQREFGVSGQVEVIWELVPELDTPLPRFIDCLFLGSRGSSVSDIPSRNFTETIALQFHGDSDSIVTVGSEDHPSIISSQLTISLWLLMPGDSRGGVLLAKTTDSGSTILYGLELQPNGGDFLIRFLYLPASRTTGSESVEVSIEQSSIADGDWHSLTVAINGSEATFYLDATPINSRTLEESSISDGAGELTVGGIAGVSDSYFTGGLQDVRVYTASLDQSQILAIATDDVTSTLTPRSGYLIYEDGDREYEITLSTVDDEIPEPSTFFLLQLTSSNGGSRIEYSENSAAVTVLKSDAANGVFGFELTSLSNTIEEGGSVSLVVERLQGDYGSVSVNWEIRTVDTDILATNDFLTSSGILEFTEGVRQVTLYVQPVDEVIPELDEDFIILLTNATSNDGFTSSTPTSGSFINSSFDQSNLTVAANDYPYGLLQFSTAVPAGSGLILAAESAPQLSVRESAGTVTIYIVRAQGTLGTVSVEYLTSDGSATGTGVTPDYLPTAGSVDFGPNDRYVSVNLTLVDDEIPEREKVFYVSLNNPTGDEGVPGLSVGRNITIQILPSDDAFGLFSFSSDSLSRLVSEEEEEEGGGGTEVTLSVQRLGGSFDDVSVYWEVEEGYRGDITPSSGRLDFQEGVIDLEFTVNITNDQVPELEEVISIRLVNATGGASVSTSGSQVATVTIRASDHPYGLFTFSTGFRPLVVSEESGEVEVVVTREFGDLGRVTVDYMTLESDASSLQGLVNVDQLQQNSQLADAGQDYTVISRSTLVFEEQDLIKSFNLSLDNDDTPEVDEYIFIAITSVTLDPASVDEIDSSVLPTAASGNGSLAFIVIGENDDARGVLELSSSTYEASESSQNFITVNRSAGHFGTVTVDWEAVAVTAQSSDFTPQSGTVVLENGVSSIQLPLSIVDDSEPEFSETLSVSLLSTSGGARLAGTLSAAVTILASDDPNGALQFALGGRVVEVSEPDEEGSASVNLVVERTGGTTGVVEVTWTISSNNGGDEPSLDIAPVSGVLQYISSVRQQTITLAINPDDIPEVAEVFTITLSDVTGGASLGEFPTATVTIEANDNPNGFVSIQNPTIVATEEDVNSLITVPIVRSGGLFRAISVIYSTEDSTAMGGTDYDSSIGEEAIIENGAQLVNVSVTILADDVPELNETFRVTLLSVSLVENLPEDSGEDGPQLGDMTSTEITIIENDDPYGRFSITGAGGASVVRVPEVGNLGVSLTVTRQAGRVGTASVSWSMTAGTAEEEVDFAGSGAVLTFSGETAQQTISLTILHDDLPERDEDIVISLSSPTGGAVLAGDGGSTVRVVIGANDNAAGIVGLTESSRAAIVQEGQTVTLDLQRSVGTLGVVQVSWEISGSGDVSMDFLPDSGTTTFEEGSDMAEIVFQVSLDGEPELSETYYLNLTGVETLSEDISEMGVAELESGATMATITLGASDHPHGVVEFQEVSLETQFEEGTSVVSLTIVREFGSVGAIDVVYQAVMGSLSQLTDNTSLATAGIDFSTSNETIRLENEQTSATINAPIIIDDTDPELSEVFLVELISVTLDSDENGDIPPSIGDNYQAQVTIPPNDNPEGILNFEEISVIVDEDSEVVSLRVRRDQGTVGRVSALVIFTDRGATIDEDYSSTLNQQDLVFESGESEALIAVTILDDSEPELAETFCISLIRPEGNAEIGENFEVCVTIQLNDDADRQFSFDSDSLAVTLDEAGDTITSANIAELRVLRRGLITGDVTIPFELEESGRDDLAVTPSTGILLLSEGEDIGIIRVTAVNDDIPELSETYTVYLLDPEAVDSDAVNLTASITIRPNQNPHGLLEIYTIDGVARELSVEEDVQYVELEIRRANGTFGEISVDLNTVAGTAISPLEEGGSLSFSVTEFLDTIGARKWYQFTRNGTQYLFLASSSQSGENSVLYEWRGVFVPVQTLATSGASAANYLSVDDRDFLVVSNYGTVGDRETNSTVYEFSEDGQLVEVQSIATEGASDVTSLLAPNGVWYLVIASREDSAGSPNVDSMIFQWRDGRFEISQSLETISASAVDVIYIEDTPYLIFTSFTDTRSRVYVWTNGEFRLDHNIDTTQATDVESATVNGVFWLAIAMGSNGVSLFRWSSDAGQFIFNSTLNTHSSIQVEIIQEPGLLLVTNSEGPGQLYSLSDLSEIQGVNLPEATHLYPLTLGAEAVYIAAAINTLSDSVEQSSIGLLQEVGPTSDFYTRSTTLTFPPGEVSYHQYLVVEIIDDTTPELDEEFSIQLSNPLGGAVLGSLSSFSINILTNDNAYGLIGFSEESLSVLASETESTSLVILTVSRERGTFGRISVSWQITGNHSSGEISPISGEVVFVEGDTEEDITLTVHPDLFPELNEVTLVELTEITESGVPPGSDDSRGAGLISGRTRAVVTVQANDDPHGVLVWSTNRVQTSELDGMENSVELTILREFGSIGSILISYSTSMDSGVPEEERATPGVDYIPVTSSVIMADTITSTTISITILHDNDPEQVESFTVSLTNVTLIDEDDRQGSIAASPRVDPNLDTVIVEITENDNSRGILQFVADQLTVDEDVGSIQIEVMRSRGLFGRVTVDFSVVGVTASDEDFSPQTGTLVFDPDVASRNITIDIVNDSDAELEESFVISLVDPQDGATIGERDSTTVQIDRNDDINGAFSFDTVLFLLTESEGEDGLATLTVLRSRSTVDEVTVNWAVSEDGVNDLEPTSGSLTFREGESEHSFQVRAIVDGLPELFESPLVELVSTVGGGRIVDPSEARIAIQASDNPNGIVGFDNYPGGIILNEGDLLAFRILRTAGLFGEVSVTWRISPSDTAVFTATSTTVVFDDGQSEAVVTVQTISDDIPETARLFTLEIESTVLVAVNDSLSQVDIIVAASDDPHGVVEFGQPSAVTIQETSFTLSIPIERHYGLVGDLSVSSYILPSSTATDSEDYVLMNHSIVIPANAGSSDLMVTIIDDNLPELSETFSLSLLSVQLTQDIDGGRDFNFSGDPTIIDLYPRLGTITMYSVTIDENDDPYGVVSLTDSVVVVNEGEMAVLTIDRSEGTFGLLILEVTVTPGSADSTDFTDISGSLVRLVQEETTATINIPITNDPDPELQEQFSVSITLSSSSSPARLGAITSATVVIDSSDSPHGDIGFIENNLTDTVSNPPSPISLTLSVERTGGRIGQTQVEWEVVGPYPGQELTDISPTGGSIIFQDGQGSGTIQLDILSTEEDDEEEKTFAVTLLSASNDVQIDPDRQIATITIEQKGMPYGTIGFFGEVLQLHKVDEGQGGQTVTFPIARSAPALGDITVPYIVTGTSDASLDVYPASGTIVMNSGLTQVDLHLEILDDDDPELEETFTVFLSEPQPSGTATLDPLAAQSTFIIRANDAPYGIFNITDPSITVDSSLFPEISRTFSYTIVRGNGQIGAVLLNVVTTYMPDPESEYVEQFSGVIEDGQRLLQVQLPVSSTSYIAPDSVFTVTISSAALQDREAQEGSGPEVGSPAELMVADAVANAEIGFSSTSLIATVNDESNSVVLTVVRRGDLGTVMVYWTTGVSGSSIANGSITPGQGSFQMNPEDSSSQILLTATPRSPHGVSEIFAVRLAVEPVVPASLPASVNPAAATAYLEPGGVIQLSSDAFSGVESSGNILVNVQRYYGSSGDIQVFGRATVATNTSIPANQEAAIESVDFAATQVQVVIPDGSTSGVLSVPVFDNQDSETLKVFQFALTSVIGESEVSPRLSTIGSTLSALLTIIDDEAGAGLFRLQPTSDIVEESSGRVSFSVSREGGSQGAVTVLIETREGNTADESIESATDGLDYIGIAPPREVVFEDGDSETKIFSISLTDDAQPEVDELFTVILSNPPGGSALIDPEADTMVVTIAASDSPGGVFSVAPATITLSEESSPSGIITVERTGGTLTQVTVEWTAVYTDGEIHNTAINSILGVDRDTLIFPIGATSVDINLTLQPNSVPVNGEMFTISIQSDDAGIEFSSETETVVTVLAMQSSLFQITPPDIRKVVTESGATTIGVERVNGTQLAASVRYATVELQGNTTVGQLTLLPAQFGVHYTGTSGSLVFVTSEISRDISLNVIDTAISYPRAFSVVISTSEPHNVRNSEATVVLSSPGPLSQLIDIYLDTLESTTTAQIESVANRLYRLLSEGTLVGSSVQFVNGQEQLQFDVTQYVLREVINRATGQYTGSLMANVSDVFQLILGDETFARRSEIVETMKLFAYSLLDGEPCNNNVPVTKTLSRLLFHLVAERISPSSLPQRRFTASFDTSDDDYVKFPKDSIFPGTSLAGVECVDVHYIELVEERILQESTLNGKVLSIGIRGQSEQTQSPVTYRIYTDTAVMPLENDCLLWNRTLKSWDDKTCRVIRSGLLPVRNNYVDCECHRLGEFAISEDIEKGFGWTLSGGLVAAFVAVITMMVICVHVCYFQRTQLVTRIFVMLCVSILLYQVMLLVAVFASDRPDTTDSGCTTIGIVLHFTVILQFVWILALAVSLWTNFMGITDGKEPLIIYTIICLVVAILWVVVTILIGRFGLDDNLQFKDVYGLVGDFCYTPELSVSLVSTLLPVVLTILATAAFFSHSCIYWSRWEDFHNMYLDSFNKTEIPLLLTFFAIVFLSGVGAYVHLYTRQVYTFGIFVTLEIFQGLYTLIVYVFLSWHTLTRKHKKYGIDDEVEPLTVPGEPDYMESMISLDSSTRRLNIQKREEEEEEEGEWQGHSNSDSKHETESDEDSSETNSSGEPPIPLALRPVSSDNTSLEGDDSQLDDLMFMLKTQNLPEGDDETTPLFPESPRKPTTSEHLELRRISIADTHL